MAMLGQNESKYIFGYHWALVALFAYFLLGVLVRISIVRKHHDQKHVVEPRT